ncbi:hypothetical protein DVH24_031884 [Malus domestica]|uniref:Uncharacterized protein n=1 Tax=Malus domestica TaxID=3750 RepID=A0A498J4I1_MALDO|nr:hypothetical protein DVH24_031884 [Malus domestica]
MLLDNHGELGQYAGAAIWGSGPSIDVHRKHVYIATGNVYSVPEHEAGPGSIQEGGTWGAATDKKMVYTNIASPSPVSVANGVLFAGSPNPQDSIYAMDTGSGKILWSYDTGATVYDGMSISNGCIYVGSGYKVNLRFINPTFTAGTSLFAFCVK